MLHKIIITSLLILLPLFGKEYQDNCLLETHTIPKDAIVIDVRTSKEFSTGHPKGAVNIPYLFEENGKSIPNAKFIEQVNKLTDEDYEATLVVICRIGHRSVEAAKELHKEGYENIVNIKKGFTRGWKKAGLPIE